MPAEAQGGAPHNVVKGGTSAHVAAKPSPAQAHEDHVRAQCVATCHYLIAHEPLIKYPPGDVRTQTVHQIANLGALHTIVEAGKLELDCSQSVDVVAHVSGAKDPNKSGWTSDGFTGTLLDSCDHIDLQDVKPGDPHVYGSGRGHHVTVITRVIRNAAGRVVDTEEMSHGGNHGPLSILASVERGYQPAGETYLRLPI